MTTITDVCKLANVSKATVSRVLSGNRKVKDDTREVVMRAVEQLNYRPNQLAQSLATKVSNTIGVMTHGLDDMQLGKTIRQLEAAFDKQNRSIILANHADNQASFLRKIAFLQSRHCDAIAVIGRQIPQAWLADLEIDTLPPLVTMQASIDALPSVRYDQALTAEMACNYLYSHGHTQIAAVLEPGAAGEQVLQGYRRALENRSLPFNKQMIIEQSDGANAVAMLINRYTPFTAVLVADDKQAVDVIHTLGQYNIKVPNEVSVLSLMTTKAGEHYSLPITGVEMPQDDMVHALVGLVDSQLGNEDGQQKGAGDNHESAPFIGRLVIRQSVKTLGAS